MIKEIKEIRVMEVNDEAAECPVEAAQMVEFFLFPRIEVTR